MNFIAAGTKPTKISENVSVSVVIGPGTGDTHSGRPAECARFPRVGSRQRAEEMLHAVLLRGGDEAGARKYACAPSCPHGRACMDQFTPTRIRLLIHTAANMNSGARQSLIQASLLRTHDPGMSGPRKFKVDDHEVCRGVIF